jgi:hypothetical protein
MVNDKSGTCGAASWMSWRPESTTATEAAGVRSTQAMSAGQRGGGGARRNTTGGPKWARRGGVTACKADAPLNFWRIGDIDRSSAAQPDINRRDHLHSTVPTNPQVDTPRLHRRPSHVNEVTSATHSTHQKCLDEADEEAVAGADPRSTAGGLWRRTACRGPWTPTSCWTANPLNSFR